MQRALSCQFLLFFVTVSFAFGQHKHADDNAAKKPPLSFESVRSEFLSDPALKDYKLESSVLTIAPGAQDTVSHRHDCDLFGYVIDGEVQIGLDHKSPVVYRTGEMFYEKRNVLHSLAANNLKDRPTRILLLFIIKNGREGYTAEYPEKATGH